MLRRRQRRPQPAALGILVESAARRAARGGEPAGRRPRVHAQRVHRAGAGGCADEIAGWTAGMAMVPDIHLGARARRGEAGERRARRGPERV